MALVIVLKEGCEASKTFNWRTETLGHTNYYFSWYLFKWHDRCWTKSYCLEPMETLAVKSPFPSSHFRPVPLGPRRTFSNPVPSKPTGYGFLSPFSPSLTCSSFGVSSLLYRWLRYHHRAPHTYTAGVRVCLKPPLPSIPVSDWGTWVDWCVAR